MLISGPGRFRWLWFWILWVVAAAVTYILISMFETLIDYEPISRALSREDTKASFDIPGFLSDYWKVAANTAFSGVVAGITQWLVLRQVLQRASLWMFTVIVLAFLNALMSLMMIGGLVYFETNIEPLTHFPLAMLLFGIVFNAPVLVILVGLPILQWLVLRQQIDQAGWWIPASILIYTTIALITLTIDANVSHEWMHFMVQWANYVITAFYTGAVLVVLMLRTDQQVNSRL